MTIQTETGKVVILTGAAGGQGVAEVRMLRERGWNVVATDVRGEVDQLHDVADEASWQEVVDATVASYGRIDGLVNNAAIYRRVLLLSNRQTNLRASRRVKMWVRMWATLPPAPRPLPRMDHANNGVRKSCSRAGRTRRWL